jgi:hypothetical protein
MANPYEPIAEPIEALPELTAGLIPTPQLLCTEQPGVGLPEELPDRAAANPAVCYCILASNRAYNQALARLDKGADKEVAATEARNAYLRAIPALAGPDNIRDFIACVTYGDMLDIIAHYEAEQLLEYAKVAITAARQESKLQSGLPKRGPGRPPKSLSGREK